MTDVPSGNRLRRGFPSRCGGAHSRFRNALYHIRISLLPPLRKYAVKNEMPLLAHLLAALDTKRKTVKDLLKFGAVAVNGVTIRQFDHPLQPGDVVTVGELRAAVAANRLEYARIQMVYEDDTLLVLDKPAGLLTVATDREKTDTLYVRLNDFLRGRAGKRRERALVVHRLDQDTSGLVLFAKTEEIRDKLQAAWATVEKTYWAIVEGHPPREQGEITSYLTEGKSLRVTSSPRSSKGAQLATTHYRVLQRRENLSLLEIRLETGRKHQIRVHLAGLGCPVAGDERYGATSDPCRRLALHAGRLAFAHPLSGSQLQFESPLPKAFCWQATP